MIGYVALAACSDPAARVALVPLGGLCGQPIGANQVRITAFTAAGDRSKSIGLEETVEIADFPPDTEQIGVEVLVGGAVGAAGKSAPLAFDALADRAEIRVFMAPPDGLCEVGALTEPRARPLVARAGAGALVVGGIGAAGPLSTAEYYDPDTAAFSAVAVPPVLIDDAQGFTGAALAALADGRVALIGGPHNAFVVFDPATRSFATDPVLIEPRAFTPRSRPATRTWSSPGLLGGGRRYVRRRAAPPDAALPPDQARRAGAGGRSAGGRRAADRAEPVRSRGPARRRASLPARRWRRRIRSSRRGSRSTTPSRPACRAATRRRSRSTAAPC